MSLKSSNTSGNSTSTSSANANATLGSTESSNRGAIAGGVVGGVAGVALIIALLYYMISKHRQKKQGGSEARWSELDGSSKSGKMAELGEANYLPELSGITRSEMSDQSHISTRFELPEN